MMNLSPIVSFLALLSLLFHVPVHRGMLKKMEEIQPEIKKKYK